MPLGIVSTKEFIKEVNNVQPGVPALVKKINIAEIQTEVIDTNGEVIQIERGRGNGSTEVPNSLRKLIGDESISNGRQAAIELAESFGLSPSSVSAYANGSTSTASYNQKPNFDVMSRAKVRVSSRARKKLLVALDKLTSEKMDECKGRELAGIAKDMSQIMINMEPKQEQNTKTEVNGPTFVLYTPQIKREEAFDSVIAKE